MTIFVRSYTFDLLVTCFCQFIIVAKIVIFYQNFDFLPKFWFFLPKFWFFLPKFWFFYQNSDFFTKILIFLPKLLFFPLRIWSSTFPKSSIFDQKFNFWPKFQFLTKISIFDQNFNFWPSKFSDEFQFNKKIVSICYDLTFKFGEIFFLL